MHAIRLRHAALALAISVGFACDDTTPCDRYVDYMCDCHGDDPGFDCVELSNAYADADASVEDQCALELDNQQASDEDAGLQCDVPE